MNLKGMTKNKSWEQVNLPNTMVKVKIQTIKDSKEKITWLIIQDEIAMKFKENRLKVNAESVSFSIGRDVEYKLHIKDKVTNKFSNDYYMKGKLLLKSINDELAKQKIVQEIVDDKNVTINKKDDYQIDLN